MADTKDPVLKQASDSAAASVDPLSASNDVKEKSQPPDPEKDLERGSSSTSHNMTPNEKKDEEDAPRDPNLVGFNGPSDLENPMNWPFRRKLVCSAVISLICLLTPLGSSMFAPGVPQVMQDFQSDNIYLASFIVSVYLLGYCCGPLILAPLSELYGRYPVYNVCNVLYVIFNVACAVAPNIASFIVFRLFAGTAGSAPLTLGAGTLADMIEREKRGAAMALWSLGPLLGPVVGPVAGGYLAEAKGWRWTFWVLAIAGGVLTILTFFATSETYAYVILDRKTKRLRKETGNPDLRSILDTGRTPRELFWFSIVRPTKMLIFSPIVFLLSLYTAVVYGYLYLLFTTIAEVFEEIYGFSQGSVGLAYLGLGVGLFLGLFVLGSMSDPILKYLTKKNGGVPKPEYRLPPLIIGAWFVAAGLFWYGWTAEKRLAWILPILGMACVGIGMMTLFMCIMTYLVDAYTVYAASATAANTVLRSLVGALLPLCGNKMYQALGLGWGNSLLGFIAVGMAPIPFLFYLYGERIRTSKLFKVEF